MSGLHRFPFYYQRFLDSTDGWSPEERWHYVRLLIVQFRDGGVDPTRLERYSPGVSAVWSTLAPKFNKGPDGLLRNPFMVEVRSTVEDERERKRGYRQGLREGQPMGHTAGQLTGQPAGQDVGQPLGQTRLARSQKPEAIPRTKTPPTPPAAAVPTNAAETDPAGGGGGSKLSRRQTHAIATIRRLVPRARREECISAMLEWPEGEVYDRMKAATDRANRMDAPGPALAWLITGRTADEKAATP